MDSEYLDLEFTSHMCKLIRLYFINKDGVKQHIRLMISGILQCLESEKFVSKIEEDYNKLHPYAYLVEDRKEKE